MESVIQTRAGEGVKQYPLRLPVDLSQALKDMAKERGQSMNTLIVSMLSKEVGEPPEEMENET